MAAAAPVQRNPKDSMKSTWRTDKSQWWFHHWLLEVLWVHPTDLNKPIPVHAKTDPMPVIGHFEGHKWVLVHALWPILLQQLYCSYYGHNMSGPLAFALYSIAYQVNGVHEFHLLRMLGHKIGFLDGDKHARDQVPDHSVSSVVHSLLSTSTIRPLFTLFWGYKSAITPAQGLSWWLPLEIGLYGLILDGWFYLYHRCMHESETLWRFHRTHHLTKHPNPLLTLYADSVQEFFDIAGIPLAAYFSLKLLGLPMSFYDWWICHQYVVFTELFGHSGLRVFAAPASTNTPFLKLFDAELTIEDHDLHHRQGWKSSMNYGKQTLFWDKLFGTCGKRLESTKETIDYSQMVKLPIWWW